MRTIFQILILILLIANNAGSQELSFGFQTGIGTYSMSGLKGLNYALPENLPFDTKLVSDFPAYWYYRPSVCVKFTGYSIGLSYLFQSTGSRVSAKDYSGEYRLDMKVRSNSPGINNEINLLNKGNIGLTMYFILGILTSNLEINEYLYTVYIDLTNDTYKYKAQNFYFEPGINFMYIYKFIGIGLNAGYLLQFGSQEYHEPDNKYFKLHEYNSREPIKPDWNGFRFGLSVYLNLSLKSE